MASVDDQVVKMSFDNAEFERKLTTTLESIQKLQKSLDFANSKKGLDDLGKATHNFNLGNMGAVIEGVSSKFLALSTIGITVLANITTKALQAGAQITKALSLDLVISGFREYETNINSIQTILANTRADGTNLEQVTAALDQLNTYSDQTIYNFGEMTRNIGTFTAAGVDLDTSVGAIKGIANLAAISGSNSQQASTAMYQLSQAISTGTVRLIDWNSVVNAGMGGEVFQKALFETGKTMGTITDTPVDTTFEEWTKAGNTFRGSLEEGWLTAEVLTTTLQGFTGEMTEAQLLAIGYTKEQAAEILELGKTGVDAATKVRTLTQLIQTTKEAIGSGWSQSFRLVLGDFEEATELFSGISDAVGKMVGDSADARNRLLQGWRDVGGRSILLEGFKNAFVALGAVIAPIKDAFRDIFPAHTPRTLRALTENFRDFTEQLIPSEETVDNLRRIFRGLFAALEIGWTVIKEGAKFFGELFQSLTGAGSGQFLETLGNIGDFITDLNDKLVDGGGIAGFFDSLSTAIQNFANDPLAALDELKNKVEEVFNILFKGDFTGASSWAEDSPIVDFLFDLREKLIDLIDVPDVLSGVFDRLQQRFEGLSKVGDALGKIWEPISNAFNRIKGVLEEIWDYITGWFSDLGSDMAAAAEPGDFDAVVDVVNVGLLGGIAAILAKFLSGGLNIDFGGGVLDQVKKTLEGLTGVLQAMQTDIKAGALLKIAGAVAVLTASVLVLSLIDSVALTKALTAMSIGFGQLLGAFAILTKLSLGPTSAAQFALIATGLVILSGALLLMSFAVKTLSTMSWEELAKGLSSVIVLLASLSAASTVLSQNAGGMIRAGTAMIPLAIGINLLALAVRQFASMEWEEIGKGLVGVAGSLVAVAAGMKLMPASTILNATPLLILAAALNLIALAVLQFSNMSWEELAKGFVGIAGGLVAIALAMQLMPATLPVTASGLLLVSGAILVIALAMERISDLSWEEIGKGLVGIAGALIIMAVAAHAMSGAIAGAIAIGIMSGALLALSVVMEKIGGLSLKEIGKALLGIAGVLLTLGLTAAVLQPLIPAMLGLSVAMLALGVGFALFGVGANLTARAFAILAKAGKAGIEVFMALVDALIDRIPELLEAMAIGLVGLGQVFLEAAPVLIEQLGVIIAQLLDTVIELAPKLAETILTLILHGLSVIQDAAPEVIATGLQLLLNLLQGIRDNIGEVVTVVAAIITEFLDAFAAAVPGIVSSLVNLMTTIWLNVAEGLGQTAGTLLFGLGISFMEGFWEGISSQLSRLKEHIMNFVNSCIDWVKSGFGIFSPSTVMMDIGVDIIEGLWQGIQDTIGKVTTFFQNLASDVLGWIGDTAKTLMQKGKDLINGLWDGIDAIWSLLTAWLFDVPNKILGFIGDTLSMLYNSGRDLVQGFWNGIKSKWDDLTNWVEGKIEDLKDTFLDPWIFGSPSKLMAEAGTNIMLGLAKGLSDTSDVPEREIENVTTTLMNSLNQASKEMKFAIESMDEFNPVITPVLDLTTVQREAGALGTMLAYSNALSADLSYDQARTISALEIQPDDLTSTTPVAPSEIKFEQTINAPEQLSTADIYRQTKNILTIAKEELNIK